MDNPAPTGKVTIHDKIILPSTHVVLEGFKETKRNVDEKEKPNPILSYSTSKVKNEQDIKKSK